MKVLDLFSGLEGWSEPFRDAGHQVLTVDNDPRFRADLVVNVMDLRPEGLGYWDIILASPPCTAFTTMTMGRNWHHNGAPKTDSARIGRALIHKTMEIIEAVGPRFFIIENPRARLRTLNLIPYERRTVWYCRYGEQRAKPTDLWGGFPPSFVAREGCHNGNPDHIAAPRGSRTGTQGGDSAVIAKIPYELADAVRIAAEHDI